MNTHSLMIFKRLIRTELEQMMEGAVLQNRQPYAHDMLAVLWEHEKWRDFKISTRLSVSQLGYIIKLFCDAGFLTNENKTQLLEFFSTFFTSSQQKNISPKSLRKKFYESERGVAESVRDIIITLLNQSKKHI